MSIGARIRQQRDAMGLTQVQLAKKCRFSQGALSRYEIDKDVPGGLALMALADALHVSETWLLRGRNKR